MKQNRLFSGLKLAQPREIALHGFNFKTMAAK